MVTRTGQYTSPTGFGKFSYDIDTDTGTFKVYLDVNWDFSDAPDVPETVYKEQFASNVKTAWDRKFKFQKGDLELEPTFHVRENAHGLKCAVKSGHGQSALIASDPPSLVLYESAWKFNDEIAGVSPTALSRAAAATNLHQRIGQAVNEASQISLTRTGDTWSVDDDDGKLAALAEKLKAMPVKQFPIVIKATSGAKGKAQTLVNTVQSFLRDAGVTYPIRIQPTKTFPKLKIPFRKHKTQADAVIELPDLNYGSELFTAHWYRYRVADHEFGHLLGLPDEYTLYPKDSSIEKAHSEWKRLCVAAGVRANKIPSKEGDMVNNLSIMCCGWVTSECHFVTLWDALTKTAGPGWQIVRGTESATVTQ
ncbi:hypothetical protein DI392_07835 [Vibrio albus]|uniref:Uncharacterized protein n=1 Tax=Vibrio albus TaxID=2200953 RepID=A0A2U3BBE0_9VIBR|nr:hypothetical protein [Vibrio albus]PWI34093.1 hypothetical protein DI392_07835 [Vibrio albus]